MTPPPQTDPLDTLLFERPAQRVPMPPVKEIEVKKWRPRQRFEHSRPGQALWRKSLRRQAMGVLKRMQPLSKLSDAKLREQAWSVYSKAQPLGSKKEADEPTMALIAEAIRRETTFTLHPVQLMAGIAMHQGHMIELATGEGKTLAALFTALCYALQRQPVHIITANAYLAKRDGEQANEIAQRLGLRAASLHPQLEGEVRQQAYATPLLYTTLHEVGFDWLRDRLAMSRGSTQRRIPRKLRVALIDEADLVMIDEARTPMVLAEQSPEEKQALFQWAEKVVSQLRPGTGYYLRDHQQVELSQETYQKYLKPLPRPIAVEARRALVAMLRAVLFYRRNVQYAVVDESIVIVDERTGRLMHGRQWPDGLHEAVTVREGLPLPDPTRHRAQITVQQFLVQYDQLCGCSGTMFEAAQEIWQVYARTTVRIPTHKPCIRKVLSQVTYTTRSEQFHAAVEQIERLRAQGRPILIGATHIATSQRMAELLKERNIPHTLLTALDEEHEAQIVARAGEPGAVTIATNMAGRGTDIKLPKGVADTGGLHVLSLQRHDSSRVDRQLFGRCARQGDPGSCQSILCLQDPLLREHAPHERRRLRRHRPAFQQPCRRWRCDLLWNQVQKKVEKLHREARINLINHQRRLDELLGKPDYLRSH